MTHWTFVEDTFFVKGRGEILCVAPTYGLMVQPGWVAQLFGPKGQVITTIIHAVDIGMDNFNKVKVYGMLLGGFSEKVVVDNWLVAIYEGV